MAARDKNDVAGSLRKDMEDAFATLDNVKVDDVALKGVTLRIGDKVLKLQVVQTTPLDVVEEIKAEYKQALNKRLESIKGVIHQKVTDMTNFVAQIREEMERKEDELKKRLDQAQIMPHITYEHAQRGLSCSPGGRKNEMFWYVRSIYWPKFIDRKPIDPKYAKKLITPMVIQITTEGDQVKGVHTKTPVGLRNFSHYHQAEPDCWGRWSWTRKWKNPDDILALAKEAEGVLENVNSGSVAKRNPIGLPTFQVLQRHLIKEKGPLKVEVDENNTRAGVTTQVNVDQEDAWST
jgi:hypothetical protein